MVMKVLNPYTKRSSGEMSLFRRNKAPLIFVLLRVYVEELEPLKKMILENGGAVRFNDKKMPIVFTQSCNYSKLIWPEKNKTLVYDIKFIKECVRQRKIVDPEPYRLSEMQFYSKCLMTHFLYGGCDCPGPGMALAATVPAPTAKNLQTVQTQSQKSSSVEDFYTATSELSERGAGIANSTGNTEDPLASSPSLNRSVKRERSSSGDRMSLNCETTVNIKIDVLSPNQSSSGSSSSTIDRSQADVTRPAMMHRPPELSSGGDRLTKVIDENEKRPCSVEYHTQVEPKLQIVAQRKKDMESSLGLGSKKRQQRTPTTLTDARDTPNDVSAPETTSAILEVMRSAPSSKNEGTNGDVVKNELEFLPPSPAKSDASTIIAQTSADRLSSSSGKRLHSETATTETPPESNWITTDDWQEQDDVNHPVSKYMRCDDGERRLLKENQQSSSPRTRKPSSRSTTCDPSSTRKMKSSMVINTFSKNYRQTLKSPTSTEPVSAKDAKKSEDLETQRVTCTSSTSDESDDDHILITRIPYTKGKANVISVLSSDIEKEKSSAKISPNDKDWNKPGPSGMKKRSSAKENISSGDSSRDEQHDGLELRKKSTSRESCRSLNTRNVKKNSANGEHCARLRVRRPSDLESMISTDDEDVDSISTKARNKMKKNKSVDKNTKAAKTVHREPSVDSVASDSDLSSYNAKVIARKNKKTDYATWKSTNDRSEAKNERKKRRKILDDNDSMPIARKTKARNGKTRSPPLETVEVDSDSNDENTSSRPATVVRTEKSSQNKHSSRTRNRRNNNCISSETDSDTSWTSHPVHHAESREDESGYRTWYSDSERREMLRYIVDKKAISRCKGEAFFQVMASEKIFRHRSAFSLYNEFRKILKKIDDYARMFNLTASTVMQFKRLRGDYK